MTDLDKEKMLASALEWEQAERSPFLKAAFNSFEKYFAVEYRGLENIDFTKPVLFVSSHSLYSIVDVLVFAGIWRQTGELVRGLGDRMHFQLPLWRKLVGNLGLVLGDQKIAESLLNDGQNVLVFPGGAREVMKKRHEIHNLVWKQRTGFIRLAINAGVPIVPVAVYGGDTVMDIVADADDYQQTLLGKLAARSGVLEDYWRGSDELPPLVKGIGLSLMPKPAKVYVSYGSPICLDGLDAENPQVLMTARQQVADEIYAMMAQSREQDGQRPQARWRRFLSRV